MWCLTNQLDFIQHFQCFDQHEEEILFKSIKTFCQILIMSRKVRCAGMGLMLHDVGPSPENLMIRCKNI